MGNPGGRRGPEQPDDQATVRKPDEKEQGSEGYRNDVCNSSGRLGSPDFKIHGLLPSVNRKFKMRPTLHYLCNEVCCILCHGSMLWVSSISSTGTLEAHSPGNQVAD